MSSPSLHDRVWSGQKTYETYKYLTRTGQEQKEYHCTECPKINFTKHVIFGKPFGIYSVLFFNFV